MRKVLIAIALATGVGFGASNASAALTVNSSTGAISGWGGDTVTPFTTTAVPSDLYYTNGNNTAPINYPGVGYVPSPGGTTGEQFDLEYLYVKVTGNHIDMLLVASSGPQITLGSTTYNLGDVLIDKGHNGTFDYGVITQSSNDTHNLTVGNVYSISSLSGLQAVPGSYYNNSTIANAIGGWAVGNGTNVDPGTLTTAQHSYGSVTMNGATENENNTWIYDYSFDMPYTLAGTDTVFQIAWGCGNDVISVDVNVPPSQNTPPPSNGAPEPASMVLGGLGLLALAARRRRPQA